jgi:BirA family biotin operon repressor/biotin-[acetyl-CoA-carboxylase] ligase
MIDTRELAGQLRVIESIAYVPTAKSTNVLGRRILDECISNELPLPSAILVAGEQTSGRGRGNHTWASPAGRGIYATVLHSRPARELALLPLEIAVHIATFLRDTYQLDARIKWPNDILLDGKKVAGILIEGRTRDDAAYMLIGTGINVAPVADELHSIATSISEGARREVAVDDATVRFIRALDAGLGERRDNVLQVWTSISAHQSGDPITFRIGSRTIRGTWGGLDEFGRAVIEQNGVRQEISAADFVMME